MLALSSGTFVVCVFLALQVRSINSYYDRLSVRLFTIAAEPALNATPLTRTLSSKPHFVPRPSRVDEGVTEKI